MADDYPKRGEDWFMSDIDGKPDLTEKEKREFRKLLEERRLNKSVKLWFKSMRVTLVWIAGGIGALYILRDAAAGALKWIIGQ